MKDLDYFKRLNEADEDEAPVESEDENTEDETSEDKPKDDKKEDIDEPDEEESAESEFIDLFLQEGFVKSFQNAIKQYVSETILDDDFNSFTVLPFIEITYKDEEYGLNAEFESAVTINLNDEGKVVESDIPDVDSIKFITPTLDNLTKLENEIGNETISVFIKKTIEDIKNVPR